MQQIYRHSDEQLEIYTTVFSPQVCRSRTRRRHVDTEQVVVVGTHSGSLDLDQADRVQSAPDEDCRFRGLSNGDEGYSPALRVRPPPQGRELSRATPTLERRGSVPDVVTPPCGCTSGHSTPKLLRRNSTRLPSAVAGGSVVRPASSPSLLHRVLAKTRRKSCPHLPHRPVDSGAINTAFLADNAGGD